MKVKTIRWNHLKSVLIFEVLTYAKRPFSRFQNIKDLEKEFTDSQSVQLDHQFVVPTGVPSSKAMYVKWLWEKCDLCCSYQPDQRPEFARLSREMDDTYEMYLRDVYY